MARKVFFLSQLPKDKSSQHTKDIVPLSLNEIGSEHNQFVVWGAERENVVLDTARESVVLLTRSHSGIVGCSLTMGIFK